MKTVYNLFNRIVVGLDEKATHNRCFYSNGKKMKLVYYSGLYSNMH